MQSLVMFVIEHGEDTDELTSFASNMREDIRFQYTDLDILDYGVKVDIPSCFQLGIGEKVIT